MSSHRYPWLESNEPSIVADRSPIRRDHLDGDYRQAAACLDVIGTVHLDGGFDPADPVGETRMVDRIARKAAFPNAIVGQVVLDRPDAGDLIQAHVAASHLVRGIRHIVAWHADPTLTYIDRADMLDDPDWRRGFSLLEALGLSFDLQVYPSQMGAAARLARDFPNVAIIIDQTGMPVFRVDEDRRLWRQGLAKMASEPNVSIKLSGFGMCGWDVQVGDIRPIVREVFDLFGADRVMFASNFPVDGLFSSLEKLFTTYAASVSDLPDGDRRKLFALNAARIYRLRLPNIHHREV